MDIALIIKYITTHGEPQHILMFIVVWLLFSIYSKAKRMYIRTNKLMQIAQNCPSISRENVLWLLDDSRNHEPPDKSSACDHLHKNGKGS